MMWCSKQASDNLVKLCSRLAKLVCPNPIEELVYFADHLSQDAYEALKDSLAILKDIKLTES